MKSRRRCIWRACVWRTRRRKRKGRRSENGQSKKQVGKNYSWIYVFFLFLRRAIAYNVHLNADNLSSPSSPSRGSLFTLRTPRASGISNRNSVTGTHVFSSFFLYISLRLLLLYSVRNFSGTFPFRFFVYVRTNSRFPFVYVVNVNTRAIPRAAECLLTPCTCLGNHHR